LTGTVQKLKEWKAFMATENSETEPISELLAVAVCPLSHASLHVSADGKKLLSRETQSSFPIINGRPDLRRQSARPWLE